MEKSRTPEPAERIAATDKIEAGHACAVRSANDLQPEVPMKYRIALHKSEEGYSVSVPGLPGCWSQGATEQEAMENIRDAIREYLSVVDEQLRGEDVREIEVAV
jgi:predicted RNase H-like HicB family nuclease